MERPTPDSPVTYDEALRIARDHAKDSDSLIPYPHEGLQNARYGRGWAFLHTIRSDRGDLDGYILVTTTAHGGGLLSLAGRTIDSVIDEHLAGAAHANRHIPDSELSPAHHLALEAYDTGLTRIDQLPGRGGIDARTADYAEFLLIALRRNSIKGKSGRIVLAHNDFLLRVPDADRRYTQPCPHCERPTVYQERYPLAVCDHCFDRTTNRAGRRVTGYNTSLGGGMIAYYTDTVDRPDDAGPRNEECVEVTRTGVCFIDGRPATMQEARFGGIVVEVAPGEPGRPRRTGRGRPGRRCDPGQQGAAVGVGSRVQREDRGHLRIALSSAAVFVACFASAVLLLVAADHELKDRTNVLLTSHCSQQVEVPPAATVFSWTATVLLIVAAAAAVMLGVSAVHLTSAAVKAVAIVGAAVAFIAAAAYAVLVGYSLLSPSADEPISPSYHPCVAFV